jgi:hypothetical protein
LAAETVSDEEGTTEGGAHLVFIGGLLVLASLGTRVALVLFFADG